MNFSLQSPFYNVLFRKITFWREKRDPFFPAKWHHLQSGQSQHWKYLQYHYWPIVGKVARYSFKCVIAGSWKCLWCFADCLHRGVRAAERQGQVLRPREAVGRIVMVYFLIPLFGSPLCSSADVRPSICLDLAPKSAFFFCPVIHTVLWPGQPHKCWYF